ncbi:O-antigen ligase family protein [Streptomyces sp. NPDC006923]|uniref:O-antigen ligase family protein n=1 Tax=Streptomyces sp. NPDC006923 TaxID=3155355 RepID=UPI0033D8A559
MAAGTTDLVLPAVRRPCAPGRPHAPGRWPAALRRAAPLLPAVAVVALLVLPSAPAGGGSAGSGTAADIASALLVLHCLVRVLRERSRPLTRTAALVLGLPVLGVAVAAITSHDTVSVLPGTVRYLQIFVLVPAALLLLIRDRWDFRLVAGSVVVLALVQGAVGVTQYLTGTGASYMGEKVRAVGTFGATDVMGMATAVSYGLVIAVGFALGAGRGTRRPWRAAALVCAVLLFVPLVLSFSRGAWIATAVALVFQLLAAGARRAVRIALATGALGVVLVCGLGVGSQMVTQRLDSITQVADAPDQSVTDRYTMWAAAAGMWRQEPVTGVGLKGFPAHRDSHASLALSAASDTEGAGTAFQRRPLLSPHNMYLLVLSEQGLLGVVALAGSWAALLVLALRGLPGARRARAGSDCALAAAGLLVWQLVSFSYGDIGGPSTVLTAVVLGPAAWWALRPVHDLPAHDGAAAA